MMDSDKQLRLMFLTRVVGKEIVHLQQTDQRLFYDKFSLDKIERLNTDVALAEQTEAFVGRFARLQDTLADKLLPSLLVALGEKLGPAIDNLDRAERFGWLESSNDWLVMRKLRNQMVHEYIEDPNILFNALNLGHQFVPVLVVTGSNLIDQANAVLKR